MTRPVLLVLPSLTAGLDELGRVRLTSKFIEGMADYCRRWPGPVRVLLEPDGRTSSGNLDDVWVAPGELPFSVTVEAFSGTALDREISLASVVQGGADYRLRRAASICRRAGAAYVYVTEYSWRTRWQIVDAESPNRLVRVRRKLWELGQEWWNRQHVRLASAVQCNGTPTYDDYSRLNDNCLLFFDSRITESMLAERPSIERRLPALRDGAPLRLAFSGRLNSMKGVGYLPRFAAALKALGVPFSLSVFGDGPLRDSLASDAARLGVSELVVLRGSVDFGSVLVPELRANVDLFICPHVQGDPSCTYLETFGCGVPIAGFLNEAFQGILCRADVGCGVPIGRAEELAASVRSLYSDPALIAKKAVNALELARSHTFAQEFERRVEQMRALLGRDQPDVANQVPPSS